MDPEAPALTISTAPAPAPEPLQVLRDVFGYTAFRGPQAEIVEHVLGGGSGLVLMPTGGGKSLCYQIPALCRPGTAVVVSPLIALMDDQVEALRQCGVRAAALHSAAGPGDDTWRQLTGGGLDLLYVSPERLLAGDLLEQLAQRPIALFAIDEAHCVSQWGHDFRPEYRQLAVLAERFAAVPRLALTATADPRTQSDIVRQLRLEQGRVFTASFDRPNIRYLLREKDDGSRQLLAFLEQHRGEAAIVYARSRKRVEQVADGLRRAGHDAIAYHAGMEPARRRGVLQRFRQESGVVVVATIAFGMGIDKPDVRVVAHVDLPRSLEAYYQETGRAGRDGLPAVAWMVHGPGDLPLLHRFIEESDAPETQKRVERGKLDALLAFAEASDCRRQLLLAHFGETLAAPCGNCDICLEPAATVDVTEPARKALSAVHRSGQRFGAAHLVEVLLGASTAKIRELGHDRLSVHGIGGELDRGQWRALFRQLVQRGYLVSDPELRGGLRFGDDGLVRPLLRGEERLELRLPAARVRGQRQRSDPGNRATGQAPGADQLNPQGLERLEQLKTWRREQARQQGVPPYVVFHDRTLIEIADRAPADLEQLAEVSGVGAAKLERYGAAVLALVKG
jgi:ATP-dependent DNA helicase RecQ